MSITLRPAAERGHANHGWLDSRHTFSFADYRDARHMNFGPLRVINEDRVAPGAGFPTHPHADMEIISYVLEGALEHKDSLGTGSVIRPGEVQAMSAGTGIRHSEFNHSKSDLVHFLQIGIIPDKRGVAPRYDQKVFPEAERRGRLRLVASTDGRDGSIMIHQDASVFASTLEAGKAVTHAPKAGRKAWVQIARGEINVNGTRATAGDGLAIEGETSIEVKGVSASAEFLLFDLP
jgi:redox-sensitive bicupin YhaK (pirin superfamily)